MINPEKSELLTISMQGLPASEILRMVKSAKRFGGTIDSDVLSELLVSAPLPAKRTPLNTKTLEAILGTREPFSFRFGPSGNRHSVADYSPEFGKMIREMVEPLGISAQSAKIGLDALYRIGDYWFDARIREDMGLERNIGARGLTLCDPGRLTVSKITNTFRDVGEKTAGGALAILIQASEPAPHPSTAPPSTI